MALPATDNFDSYANASDLSASASWTAALSDESIYKPASDGEFIGKTDNSEAGVYWDDDAFNANQYAQIVLVCVGTGGYCYVGPAVRMSSQNYYGCYFSKYDTQLYLFKVVGSNWTELAADAAANYVTNDILYLEVTGLNAAEVITAKRNGTAALTKSADGSLDSGSAGVCSYAGVQINDTRGDSWEGGDLEAGGPSSILRQMMQHCGG